MLTGWKVIDPQLTRGDRLVGQVLGSKGSLPSIYTEIEINYFLLRRLLGVKTDDKKQTKVRLGLPPFPPPSSFVSFLLALSLLDIH